MNTTVQVTPNVTISNPKVRRVVRTVLDSFGGLVFIAAAVDVAAPAFNIEGWTGPALAGYAVARVVFGFAVDSPNTPTDADIIPAVVETPVALIPEGSRVEPPADRDGHGL